MPPAPPDEAAASKPIHRARIAFNVALQLVLILVIVLAANYLSCRHHRQWDLTKDRDYTLSTVSTGFLESLEQDVTLVVAFLQGSEIYDEVRALADEYERHGNGRVTIEYVDPGRSPARIIDLRNRYQLEELDQNAVIVITRAPDPEPAATAAPAGMSSLPSPPPATNAPPGSGAAKKPAERIRVVTENGMITRGDNGLGRIIEFRGEAAITSAMVQAVEKKRTKLYLATGHRPLAELTVVMKQVAALTAIQQAEIAELILPQADTIPDDADALILVGPVVDPSEREIEMLREYWEDRKGSLFLLLNPTAETPNLHAFVRRYGIVPRADRVLFSAVQKTYIVPAVFLPGSPITRSLVGVNTRLLEQTQSLRVYENDPQLEIEKISVTPLLLADERFWGETSLDTDPATFDEEEDHVAPLYLAASIEKGAAEDPRLRIESSRMVIAGNSHLTDFAPQRIKPNHDFVVASINWLIDREDLIGIAPRLPTDYSVTLSPREYSRLQLIVLVLMPASAFLLAFIVYSMRRH